MEVIIKLLPLPPALKSGFYLLCFCQSNFKLSLILHKFHPTHLCTNFPKIPPAYDSLSLLGLALVHWENRSSQTPDSTPASVSHKSSGSSPVSSDTNIPSIFTAKLHQLNVNIVFLWTPSPSALDSAMFLYSYVTSLQLLLRSQWQSIVYYHSLSIFILASQK